jgi:hypothetical protein
MFFTVCDTGKHSIEKRFGGNELSSLLRWDNNDEEGSFCCVNRFELSLTSRRIFLLEK